MLQFFKILSVIGSLWLASLIGCKSISKSPAPIGEASSDLTWTEAQERKSRLSNVAYDLTVDLTAPDSNFSGRADIQFDLKGADKPLRLDFFEGKIASLSVNDKAVAVESAKKPYWIELPGGILREGHNRVIVNYVQAYSTQGQGLHKFVDPQTKQTFLYSQFETFDANRFMPCFDQPDLRATLALTVDAPATWEVISTTRETSIKVKAQQKRWSFPKTLPISTYLFSLHAGPYKVWKDQYSNIPLRIYARPSMAKYVRHEEWFQVTKQGLKFFEGYFNYKYPFKKYDQLFVPEFNAGAMENVGAVTFSERYLSRSTPTRQERMGAMSTLLHEMAHMWFGDVVTMKWWNDLWLNESFATFMATLALQEATEYKEAWQDFFSGTKNWAYWEDSLVTTHPIEAPVANVKDAFATFDGITYGKGASVLKQLQAYVTPEGFKKGIQSYIATYAMKNAELKDFIGALQAQTPRDLNLWADRWLRQSDTDKVTVSWTCSGPELKEFTLINTSPAGTQFRPQAVNVALFTSKSNDLKNPTVVRAEMTRASETFKGNWNCPTFVYPNYGDYGYLAVKLDATSLEFAKKNLSSISDVLLRTMVWDDLWEMVRATEMPLKDYVEIVNTHFANEKNDILLEQITRTVSASRGDSFTLYYWPQTPGSSKARSEFIVKTEAQFLKRFSEGKTADEQKLWLDNFIDLAQTPLALDHLAKWARLDKLPNGLPLDLDRRWSMVRQLNRYRHPSASELLVEMKSQDPSDRGVRSALAVEAAQPDPAVKRKWVNILKQPKPEVSFAEARAVSRSLFLPEQKALAQTFAPEYFEYLKVYGNSENENFVELIADSLAPLSCEATFSEKFKAFLASGARMSPSVTKVLKVELQEDERCQKIRAASAL